MARRVVAVVIVVAAPAALKQLPLPVNARPEPSFESFLPGANALAFGEVQAMATSLSALASSGRPPLYLWGPSGSGKTHLLRSLAARCESRGVAVAWADGDMAPPWALADDDAAATLVVIDDCDALDARQQQAAFALFVEAAGRPCRIAAAGRLPPVDLPLREDLRSRLGWGTVLGLLPLADADVAAALRGAARQRGLVVADDVIHHLMTRFERDLKHQIALLDRLDDFALEHRRAISLPLLRAMLAEQGPPP